MLLFVQHSTPQYTAVHCSTLRQAAFFSPCSRPRCISHSKLLSLHLSPSLPIFSLSTLSFVYPIKYIPLLHWLFCCKKSPVAACALFGCILPPTGQLQQLSLYITCNKQQLVGGDYYQLLQQVTSVMSPFYKGASSAKCG